MSKLCVLNHRPQSEKNAIICQTMFSTLIVAVECVNGLTMTLSIKKYPITKADSDIVSDMIETYSDEYFTLHFCTK